MEGAHPHEIAWAVLAPNPCSVLNLSRVPAANWEELLSHSLASLTLGALVVIAERSTARSILSFLARRKRMRIDGPSPREVRAVIERSGKVVYESYDLWPSAQYPKIIFQSSPKNVRRWVQRTGILGGGGTRLWARAATRSRVFTPFVKLLTPAVALVVITKPKDQACFQS